MRAACVVICEFLSSVEFAAKFLKLFSACGQKYIVYIPQRIFLNGEEVCGIIP